MIEPQDQSSGRVDASGVMGECVMSVYGIARLLGSRDIGSAKLVPPIEAFSASAQQHWDLLHRLFADLGQQADRHDCLRDTVALVAGEARRICDELSHAFNPPFKLRARQRLELERAAQRLGGELEAIRWLSVVTAAALNPRTALVSPDELLGDQWRSGPLFVVQKVKLAVPPGLPAKLQGDPRVLRALLEHYVRKVHAAGARPPVLDLQVDGPNVSLGLGKSEGALSTTIEQVTVPLGVALDIEEPVLAAVAERVGISVAAEPGGGRATLALRAA
jgi:hypothetical protein